MRKEILTCDRCKRECLGLFGLDLGKDYTAGVEKRDQRRHVELCKTCQEAVVRFATAIRDTFGREIDLCGQVKCALDNCEISITGCETRINYEYSDGTPRKYCAEHESEEDTD